MLPNQGPDPWHAPAGDADGREDLEQQHELEAGHGLQDLATELLRAQRHAHARDAAHDRTSAAVQVPNDQEVEAE